MYGATITLFNLYESPTAAIWYPHVLTGVDLNTDKGQILKKYGPDSKDNAELHIAYADMDGQKVIVNGLTGEPSLNTMGEPLPRLPPQERRKQVHDLLDDTITFTPGDFFWDGEWTQGPVNDEDYQDRRESGFYEHMNLNYDFVYRITSVGGPYAVIPHFEILGA